MSQTCVIGGVRVVDLPDLGPVTDDSSVVGEHAGAGRFDALALATYVSSKITSPISAAMGPVISAATLAVAEKLLTGFTSISAAATFYVARTGNDTTGDGSSGNPWLTIQHAIDTVTSSCFIQNAYVVIQVIGGTFSETPILKNFVGSYVRQALADSTGILLRGDPTTPANVKITNPGAGFALNAAGLTTNWVIDGFEISAPSGSLLLADWGSTLSIGNMNWGACSGNMIQAQYHSRVELMRNATQKLVGGTPGAFCSANGESIILAQGASGGQVCTINTNGQAVGAGVSAQGLSFVDLTAATFVGAPLVGIAFGATNSVFSQFNDNIIPATQRGSQQGIRIPATGLINYYVSASGNDVSGRGSVAAPFRQIDKCIAYALSQMDTLGLDIAVNVTDGTFTDSISVSSRPVGGGSIVLIGDVAAPNSCVISVTGDNAIKVSAGASLRIRGFGITSTANAIYATQGASVVIDGNMSFNECLGAHMRADLAASITAGASYSVSQGAAQHMLATQGGQIAVQGVGVTVAPGLTFSAFAAVADNGTINTAGTAWSINTATGLDISATTNGVINTSGAPTPYFPSNSAGTPSSGAQYV